jgi:hypothetical protein
MYVYTYTYNHSLAIILCTYVYTHTYNLPPFIRGQHRSHCQGKGHVGSTIGGRTVSRRRHVPPIHGVGGHAGPVHQMVSGSPQERWALQDFECLRRQISHGSLYACLLSSSACRPSPLHWKHIRDDYRAGGRWSEYTAVLYSAVLASQGTTNAILSVVVAVGVFFQQPSCAACCYLIRALDGTRFLSLMVTRCHFQP